MRKMIAAALLGLFLLGTGCQAPWTPEQKANALAAVDAAEQQGHIDEVGAAAAREAIEEASSGFDSSDILRMLFEVGAAAGLAYLGVNVRRGKPKPMSESEAEALKIFAQQRIAGSTAS